MLFLPLVVAMVVASLVPFGAVLGLHCLIILFPFRCSGYSLEIETPRIVVSMLRAVIET